MQTMALMNLIELKHSRVLAQVRHLQGMMLQGTASETPCCDSHLGQAVLCPCAAAVRYFMGPWLTKQVVKRHWGNVLEDLPAQLRGQVLANLLLDKHKV